MMRVNWRHKKEFAEITNKIRLCAQFVNGTSSHIVVGIIKFHTYEHKHTHAQIHILVACSFTLDIFIV